MMKFSNLLKPTPARVKRWVLSFKVFIGSISGAAYFNDYPKAAFGLLVAGAFLDFIIDALYGEDQPKL